jgi:hypothetical protein
VVCFLWILFCALITGCAKKPLAVALVAPLLGPPAPPMLFTEPFHVIDGQRWREVEVKGRTQYAIEEVEGAGSLKAHSRAGASILLSSLRFDPDTYEWLSWRWRVAQLVEGEPDDRYGQDPLRSGCLF